jgi:hypothetical protein
MIAPERIVTRRSPVDIDREITQKERQLAREMEGYVD